MEGVLSKGDCFFMRKNAQPIVDLIETFPSTRVMPVKDMWLSEQEKQVKPTELVEVEIKKHAVDDDII